MAGWRWWTPWSAGGRRSTRGASGWRRWRPRTGTSGCVRHPNARHWNRMSQNNYQRRWKSWPCHARNTSSDSNTKVKLHWAGIVLGWETAWELLVQLTKIQIRASLQESSWVFFIASFPKVSQSWKQGFASGDWQYFQPIITRLFNWKPVTCLGSFNCFQLF